MYIPMLQSYHPEMTVLVRTTGDPKALAAAVRGEVQQLDRNLPVYDIKALPEHLSYALWASRMGATLAAVFAAHPVDRGHHEGGRLFPTHFLEQLGEFRGTAGEVDRVVRQEGLPAIVGSIRRTQGERVVTARCGRPGARRSSHRRVDRS